MPKWQLRVSEILGLRVTATVILAVASFPKLFLPASALTVTVDQVVISIVRLCDQYRMKAWLGCESVSPMGHNVYRQCHTFEKTKSKLTPQITVFRKYFRNYPI